MEYYYKTFDSDRNQLAPLYVCGTPKLGEESVRLTRLEQRNDSMLTFEGAPCQGVAQIVEKLQVRCQPGRDGYVNRMAADAGTGTSFPEGPTPSRDA